MDYGTKTASDCPNNRRLPAMSNIPAVRSGRHRSRHFPVIAEGPVAKWQASLALPLTFHRTIA